MSAEPNLLELQRLLDVEAIRDLLRQRYCHLCDARTDTSFVRQIFTEDAVDDHGLFGTVFRGWAELEGMYERSSEFLETAAHFVTNEHIEIHGDTATGRSYVQCWTWLRESAHLGELRPADYVLVGVYHDELTRTPAGWRVSSRVLRPLGTGALGLGTPHEVYFGAYRTAPAPTAQWSASFITMYEPNRVREGGEHDARRCVRAVAGQPDGAAKPHRADRSWRPVPVG